MMRRWIGVAALIFVIILSAGGLASLAQPGQRGDAAGVTTQDAWNVELLGSYDTPGSASGVAISGEYAYIADGDGGLRVVNVSSPMLPVEVGHCDTSGSAHRVAVEGDYAYVTSFGGGLWVVDVSNPAAPVEVGACDTSWGAEGVAVSGGYAYVTGRSGVIRIIDVSNPADPRETGSCDTPGVPLDVAVSGQYAYVADWSGGLRVVDVSVPSAPIEVGSYDTPGLANGVAVYGAYAYVADDYHGLRVIDVSNPSDPREVGACTTPGYARGVAISEGYAYVADDFVGGLRVISVQEPSTPREVGFYNAPDFSPWRLSMSGRLAYVPDGSAGLLILRFLGEPTPTPTRTRTSTATRQHVRIVLPVIFKRMDTCPEPLNETRGGACGPLISDMTYHCTMESSADNWDWYYFDLGTTHAVEAWLSDIPVGCDYDLYLYDASDERVGFSGGIGVVDEHIVTEPLPAGRYYLGVFRVPDYGWDASHPYALRAVYR